MNSPTKPCVAVIGGGIVGTAVACTLAQRGLDVTVFDGAKAQERASYGNAGFLATELIDPLATIDNLRAAPAMWWRAGQPLSLPGAYLPRLTPWLWRFVRAAGNARAQRARHALSALNRRSVAAWQRLLNATGLEPMLDRCGYLLTWETPAARDAARRHAEHLARWDIACRVLGQAEVRDREPALATTVSHALYFPHAYRMRDPQHLLAALQADFATRGGAWRRRRVRELAPGSDAIECVTNDGRQRFDQAVVCAGAWSHRLLAPLKIRVPLETERGYHLTFDEKAPRLAHALGSAERRVVLSELDRGLRIVGFTELGGLERPPNPRHFDALARHAQALLAEPRALGEPTERWMGFRPSLPDSLPVIDRCAAYPRIFCAFGHQHLGLTQAAVTAELLSARVIGERPAIDLAPYSLSRFG